MNDIFSKEYNDELDDIIGKTYDSAAHRTGNICDQKCADGVRPDGKHEPLCHHPPQQIYQ